MVQNVYLVAGCVEVDEGLLVGRPLGALAVLLLAGLARALLLRLRLALLQDAVVRFLRDGGNQVGLVNSLVFVDLDSHTETKK